MVPRNTLLTGQSNTLLLCAHTNTVLTLSEPQSRFGDKPLRFQVVFPQNGTAALKGLNTNQNQKWLCKHEGMYAFWVPRRF